MEIKKFWVWLIPAIANVMLLVGCGSADDGDLLSRVPDDVVVVKRANLDLLLREAGCGQAFDTRGNLRDNAYKVVSLAVTPDFRDALTALLKTDDCVALNHLVTFTASEGYEVVVMPLLNRDRAVAAIDAAARGKLKSVEGYDYARVGDVTVAVDRHFCWIAPDLKMVRECVAKASHSHFGSLIGVCEFVNGDNAMNIAVNCGNSMLSFFGDGSRWLGVSVKISNASVTAEGVVIDRDGMRYPLGADFEEIDTDFLRYTPNDAAVVLAFGKFSGNIRALGFLLGRFAPIYLDEADGTTSLYAVAAGSAKAVAEKTPGAWNVETMVHVPQDVLVSGIEQYKSGAGETLEEVGDQWTYRSGDENYFFGAFDGCLVFSTNREISSQYNNGFTEDFSGKRAAMVVTVPAGGVLAEAWGLSCGFNLKIAVEESRWKARISFNGSDMNAFESLLSLPQIEDYYARFEAVTGK